MDTPVFVDAAEEAGLVFSHDSGATGEFFYPEIAHAGATFLDYDNDGFLDVYLPQGGPLPPSVESGSPGPEAAHNQLFHNQQDGTFVRVPGGAGVDDAGYGLAGLAADYDRDGLVDLYVTNLGRNRLYRNRGEVGFEDTTAPSGVGDPGYSAAATFFDYDGDNDLDLYVVNYVAWSHGVERPCYRPNGQRHYCGPRQYEPQPDSLFRNEGDGRFHDVSVSSGIRSVSGAGLGVVTADFDGDGLEDIYVANDQMANYLWINQGDGTFVDEALMRGVAFDRYGKPEASMGIAIADPDADEDWDLFVVHLTGETNTFYLNQGEVFVDTTDELRLSAASKPYTGFGTGFFDYDNDGVLDIFVANGKVVLGASSGGEFGDDYSEPNQLFRGLAAEGRVGGFSEIKPRSENEVLAQREVSRGVAFGDYDNDGDTDLLLGNNNGPVRLLRNEVGSRQSWLTVDLCGGSRFGRHAVGSRVSVKSGGTTLFGAARPGYSYGASNDPRVHFGLGLSTAAVTVRVTWPDGSEVELTNVAVNQILAVAADGVVEQADRPVGCNGAS